MISIGQCKSVLVEFGQVLHRFVFGIYGIPNMIFGSFSFLVFQVLVHDISIFSDFITSPSEFRTSPASFNLFRFG